MQRTFKDFRIRLWLVLYDVLGFLKKRVMHRIIRLRLGEPNSKPITNK